MKVEVQPVSESDRPTIANLLQLYFHDFSEFDGSRIAGGGLFQYPHLSKYWEERDRHAFLVTADGMLAGFALIKKGTELAGDMLAMDVAEFFVLRGWRRKGVGREAFRALVQRFPGRWPVRVQEGIPGALAFWERTIPSVSQAAIDRKTVNDGDREWTVFRFAVPNLNKENQSGQQLALAACIMFF